MFFVGGWMGGNVHKDKTENFMKIPRKGSHKTSPSRLIISYLCSKQTHEIYAKFMIW